MIDFRYHIVSIVSIFIALGVGIVLGAGPLKGEIGSTLQSEVAGLRQDKTQLNEDLTQAQGQLDQRDAFLSAVSDRVVRGALEGQRVALVVLPGADAAVSESVAEAVDAAGGTVASTTSVAREWVSADPDTAAARDQLVEQVALDTGTDLSQVDGGMPQDVLLAQLLTRSAPVSTTGPDTVSASEGLQALSDGGLISFDAPDFARAELAVVVAGAVTDGTEEDRTATAQRWVGLAAALESEARGVVLASDVGAEADGVSVLAALRGDEDARGVVSGVDDAGDPTGIASVVFALDEQISGDSGQYGLAPGADAPFAPVPGS